MRNGDRRGNDKWNESSFDVEVHGRYTALIEIESAHRHPVK